MSAATVTAHEQRSALGLDGWKQVPRGREDDREPQHKLLADGLTALTEALRVLDAKLEKVEQQVRSITVG